MTLGRPLLHHRFIAADGVTPRHWLIQLHGIFGSGRNWATFARRLTERCTGWGVVAVDLRMHGRSQGFPPPHTLGACVEDVIELAARITPRPDVVSGHSFGGKVALAYASERVRRGDDRPMHVWVLDSDPAPRATADGGNEALSILDLLGTVPVRYAQRGDFARVLVDRGIRRRVADWLSMNVRRDKSGYYLQMDLPALGAMLRDALASDLWPAVDRIVDAGSRVHFVVGGRSKVVDDRARGRMGERAAADPGLVRSSVLPDAGHWLHTDDLEGLLGLFTGELCGSERVIQ